MSTTSFHKGPIDVVGVYNKVGFGTRQREDLRPQELERTENEFERVGIKSVHKRLMFPHYFLK